MLLDSTYTLIPQLRFTLTYDNDVQKTITVKQKMDKNILSPEK